jgi:UDP-2-acetamido-3-amino-2,3-dideoxy-glucuronate N-acetyltransferase
MERQLRVGLVGTGYWGTTLLSTFGKLPQARVTALCDLDPARLDRIGHEHPDLRTVPDLAHLLSLGDVDAVLVATPPSLHHAMALDALRAGKHVWVEKPLALTAAEGRELVDAARAAGRTLFVDHTFLYDPMVTEMQRLVEAGDLGDVWHVSLQRLGMGRIRRDSNVWWNSAPHDLSILFHLVPRAVESVRLHLHTYLQPGVADMAVCDLELAGGVSAHVYLSWLHPEKTAKVVVVGSRRILAYEGRFQQRALVLHDYAVDRSAPAGGGAPILPITDQHARTLEVPDGDDPLTRAATHFVECAQSGREPLTSGAAALRALEVLESAERHATRGGLHR